MSHSHHPKSPQVLGVIFLLGVIFTGCGGGTSPKRTSTTTSTTVVPRGEKPVSYLGVTIDVPTSWTVAERAKAFCRIPGPGVIFGPPPPQEKTVIQCPYVFLHGTVVTFGGPDSPAAPLGPESQEAIDGITVLVSQGRAGNQGTSTIWQETVQFPSRTAWLVMKALGANEQTALARARDVLETVHIASEPA